MARTWLAVRVDLLGGRGEDLWPLPGRVLVVGPSHTFAQFADAVNTAFGRWDHAHLSLFTLADGREITDAESAAEFAASAGGRLLEPMDSARTRLARTLRPGDEFRFVFDLGDTWTHHCTVEAKVDPLEVLGVRPDRPLPAAGWGTIPDQYGRRWREDRGEDDPPALPEQGHPRAVDWPAPTGALLPDRRALRAALVASDAGAFLDSIVGRDVDTMLQQVGSGIPLALHQQRSRAEPIALSIVNRLLWRGWPGDEVLADDLVAVLRRQPLDGGAVPVDLEALSELLEGDPETATGGYLDLHTGEVVAEAITDAAMVGEDAVDVDSEPDRWLRFYGTGSRSGWQDLADFAQDQPDPAARDELRAVIEGRGAFRRFRDVIGRLEMVEEWLAYSTDRRWGRARLALADLGHRVGPREEE